MLFSSQSLYRFL